MPTKLFLSQLRLLQFQPMKLHSSPFLSRTFFKFSHLSLRNAPFRLRPFSSRPDRIRSSKSLIDDEADLSNWVDALRTDNFASQRMDSRPAPVDDGRSGPRKSGVGRGSSLGKRGGDDFRKGKPNLNSKRRFQLSSDNDDGDSDEVVVRGKFKGGGGSIGKFLSEEETEDVSEGEEESRSRDDEEIVNKSRSVLFGKQNVVSNAPRPSSPSGTASYLSDSRCVSFI